MLNFPKMSGNTYENNAQHLIFAEQLLKGVQHENCMIIAKGITDFPKQSDRLRGTIDIWWIVHDGGILLLIAYLLQQNKVWRGCKLNVYVIAQSDEDNEEMKKRLQQHIYNLRIDASVFVSFSLKKYCNIFKFF